MPPRHRVALGHASAEMAPNRSRKSVVIVQTVIPDYRTRFFEELASRLPGDLQLLSGEQDWQPDVWHDDDVPSISVRNLFFARRQLLWQRGVLRRSIAADVTVLSLNPRIVSGWITLVMRRALRRRTLLWGHAWPRKGRQSATDHVRGIMRRLASSVIVYSETEAAQLRDERSAVSVVAAPNALYRRSEIWPGPITGSVRDLVCVGRLTASKRPQVLLEAFIAARHQLPQDVRLVFVGDGPLREPMEARLHSVGLEEHVVLAGHVSSLERLRDTYAHAFASASAGEVGLSLLQSLGFGVPMILATDADHGPEVEAAIPGVNAVFFERDSMSSLITAIVDIARQRDAWVARRDELAAFIREHHSVDAMVTSFVDALGANGLPDRPG